MQTYKPDPKEQLQIRGGRLYMEGCELAELAASFGTPVFVLSEAQIRRNYRHYDSVFKAHWPEGEVEIMPAIKAAPFLAVRRILSSEGAGCDVFGESELEAALRGGTDPEKISVNGSIKNERIIERAITIGADIVLDSPHELTLCADIATRLDKTARVLLRLKPEFENCDVQSDFAPVPVAEITQAIKYGIPTNEVRAMGPVAIAHPLIDLVGVHVHIGRHSTDMAVWRELTRATVKLVASLGREWGGWTPRIIDLGGGFAPPRDNDPDVPLRTGAPGPPAETYAREITGILRQALREYGIDSRGMILRIEPGRGLHANTGVHLTRIVNLKENSGSVKVKWAETDTSEFFLGTFGFDPSKPHFTPIIANKAGMAHEETVDLVGKSCGSEWICMGVTTPKLDIHDIVALIDTGAYIETLSCNFNAMPRPGTVLVAGDNAEWIKQPETIDDVFARDIIPARLQT